MPKSLNRVMLLGRTGNDPEVRATGGGTLVASVSLATDERYKDATSNTKTRTTWHNLVAFGRMAEIFRDYVRKGAQLYVEGRLQTDSWDDKQSGQKRYKTNIVVSDVILLDKASGQNQAAPAPADDDLESAIPF